MTDASPSIARRAVSDAPDARDIGDLYRDYFHALCTAVRRRFGAGPPDPEEAAQAAFAQFAELRDHATIRNPRGFLFRTACNFVLDHRRHEAVSARAQPDILTLEALAAPADPGPERVIIARDSLAAVNAAIETLDQRRRDVLMMRSIEGLSCAEIARRLDISATRVIQLYADAVKACAQALREAGAQDND